MTDERGVLRRIAWRELFPWLIIFRTFRLAISPTLLLVATLAVFLSGIGSQVGKVFLKADHLSKEGEVVFKKGEEFVAVPSLRATIPPSLVKYLPVEESAAQEGYLRLADPLYRFFNRKMSLGQAAHFLFVSLWSLAIWAFAGGIIARRAVVELGAEETPDFLETVRFVARRYVWYFLAPLYPLCGVLLLMLPIAALGLVARGNDLGVVLAGLVWILAIVAGLVAAWLLAGLLFGFPLMWGTISAEREGDAFEAFSRSFSYVYGKPLHYLFYAVVAALFGALGWAVVQFAADIVIEFGFWSLSWGVGTEGAARIESLAVLSPISPLEEKDQVARLGGILMALSIGLVRLVETGFIFSFFWCVASAIYLLLRQDVDDKEIDDVYIPAETPAPKGPEFAAATPAPEPISPAVPAAESQPAH